MTVKKQVRAVIRPALVPLANEIMAETGIKNHSELVCLLIKNYGDTLLKSLKTGDTGTPKNPAESK